MSACQVIFSGLEKMDRSVDIHNMKQRLLLQIKKQAIKFISLPFIYISLIHGVLLIFTQSTKMEINYGALIFHKPQQSLHGLLIRF